MKRHLAMVSIIFVVLVACGASWEACGQELQNYLITPPWAGQVSEFSIYAIKPTALVELTNGQVNDIGLIQSRAGFVCWLDSVSKTEKILGATNYKRWIEGGATEQIVFNTNNKIYWTKPEPSNTNTDISGGLTFSDDGIPVWSNYYNDLFMANSENNPIQYDQDGNCIQMGRCTFAGTVTFQNDNEVASTTNFESGSYHFRPGWDLIIADSNNNGTYEITSVDSNVITVTTTAGVAVDWTNDGAEVVTLTGLGTPTLLSTTRTESANHTTKYFYFVNSGSSDYINIYFLHPYSLGFRVGMTVVVSGSASNDGSKGTITRLDYFGNWGYIYVSGSLTDEQYDTLPLASRYAITLAASQTITTEKAFNPQCLAGHKSRLFAGGVKEYPTYLFYSISRLLGTQGTYYYDMWRDRYGYTDGSGYIIMHDKIQALIPEYYDNLLILCEDSIYRLEGNDPGFDILTPSQQVLFAPVPISTDVGCVGPNAWCKVGNDVFFWSKNGLQKLSIIAQYGNIQTSIMSIPVNNLVETIINYGNQRKINMVYLPLTGNIYINCAIAEGDNDSMLVFNVQNGAFSKYTFADGSEPLCVFKNTGPNIDPNETRWPNADPLPYETIWFGSEDGKFFAMNDSYQYDRDYEDPNDPNNIAISFQMITGQVNLGDPFLLKNFRDWQLMVREKVNYTVSAGGSIGLYYRKDNDSWTTVSNKSFTTRTTPVAGTEMDKYEFIKYGAALATAGHTIGFKITSSNYYGLELMGMLLKWSPMRWEP